MDKDLFGAPMRAVVRGDYATRFTSGARTLFDKPCLWCGNLFRPDRGRIKFCSIRCSQDKTRAAYRKPPRIIFEYECKRCGSDFEDERDDRRFCSKKCAQPPPLPCKCKECGTVYVPLRRRGKPSAFCSPRCGRRADRRIQKAKAKAVLRARRHKNLDPLAIFERDSWTCKLCRIPTPPHLRGTYDPRAPELDHIIALARGGEHTAENTQCLCKRCNAMKSDHDQGRVAAQLPLL